MELFFVRSKLVERFPAVCWPSPVAVRSILEHRALPDGLPVFVDEDAAGRAGVLVVPASGL
jgi:hypothetical protein